MKDLMQRQNSDSNHLTLFSGFSFYYYYYYHFQFCFTSVAFRS